MLGPTFLGGGGGWVKPLFLIKHLEQKKKKKGKISAQLINYGCTPVILTLVP